jgi:hypothetical protein
MEIDARFPTKLNTVSDAPEPLRIALLEGLPSEEPVRLLVHSPAFSSGDEISPATVLAVTGNGWLVASATEEGGAALVKSEFGDTLFLEVRSILLSGQLRISFASGDASHSVAINFESVEEECYREAIDLILAAIDPAHSAAGENDQSAPSGFENWPMKFRNEVKRYLAKGGRSLVALQWPAVVGEFQRQLAPAGALAITERELVIISDERESPAETPAEETKERPPETKHSPEPEPTEVVVSTGTPSETPFVPALDKTDSEFSELPGDVYEYGENITIVPRVRLADFEVSHQEHFGVLALQVRSAHGGGKLEVIFPSGDEKAVSKAMAQASLSEEPRT